MSKTHGRVIPSYKFLIARNSITKSVKKQIIHLPEAKSQRKSLLNLKRCFAAIFYLKSSELLVPLILKLPVGSLVTFDDYSSGFYLISYIRVFISSALIPALTISNLSMSTLSLNKLTISGMMARKGSIRACSLQSRYIIGSFSRLSLHTAPV